MGLNKEGKVLLIDAYPNVAQQWHPHKNINLNINDFVPGSKKIVWWLGECGHEWDSKIVDRCLNNSGCPICYGRRILPGFNDINTTHPYLVKIWHPHKNSLQPTQISAYSNKLAWWTDICGHEWSLKIYAMTENPVCPFCFGRKLLRGFNDLETKNPKIASEWNYLKNNTLLPSEVIYNSSKKVWWIDGLGHQWQASVTNRYNYNSGCPYCANIKVLKGFNDLESQRPERAKRWHPTKNSFSPDEVAQWSGKKAWWLCEKSHEWETSISSKHGCPICSGQQVLIGFNDLQTVNPIVASSWHPTKNGQLLPTNFTSGSHKKAWWKCINGHEWNSFIDGRNGRGYGCPDCSSNISVAEQEIVDYLVQQGITVEPSNRKILKGQELDLYIPSHNMAIEYNGLYWHTERSGKDRNYHYNKWFQCKQLGIQLIQVWENDWNKDKELIKKMLLHKLGISDDRKVFARKTNVSMVNTTVAKEFLDANHIQGFASGSAYVALIEKNVNDSDPVKIVALMTLKKEQEKLNIVRYATSCNVVGGFSKILRYVENNFEYDLLYTFSDHCISDGSLYANNGFIADKELPPDYKYHVNGDLKHKFGYRLKRFREDPNLLWEEGLTESQLAELNGIERIWDAGKTRWIKPKI